jgi:hypothetical protein
VSDYDRDQLAIERAQSLLDENFGEGYPEAATLRVKGDGIVGHFVRIDAEVDLKTGYAPVDMLVLRAIAGVWHGDEGVEVARKGAIYSVAIMHQTLRNRLDEAAAVAPIVTDEVVAIRRGRVFESNRNPGQEAVAYDVSFPGRPEPEPAPEAKAKGGTRGKRQTVPVEPPAPPHPAES